MFVKIFDNYHAGVSMMTEAEQDAFYGAVMRYAFEGTEPDFEGIAAAVWMTIRDFIDKSIQGQGNGSKGGNGRGNRNPSKDPRETQPEKESAKGGYKTPSENQKNRRERNGKENPKGFFSNSAAAPGGAEAARAAPPSAPACPNCGSGTIGTNSSRPRADGTRRRMFVCPDCNEEVWEP